MSPIRLLAPAVCVSPACPEPARWATSAGHACNACAVAMHDPSAGDVRHPAHRRIALAREVDAGTWGAA
jgi:hypothetical protein